MSNKTTLYAVACQYDKMTAKEMIVEVTPKLFKLPPSVNTLAYLSQFKKDLEGSVIETPYKGTFLAYTTEKSLFDGLCHEVYDMAMKYHNNIINSHKKKQDSISKSMKEINV